MQSAILAAATGALVAAIAFPANAGDIPRYFDQFTTGSGACQAALPVFEGQIRKRPLAIQNEGTASAFVSCAPHQFNQLYDPDFGLFFELVNNSGAAVTINCTAIALQGGVPLYIARTVSVPANSTSGQRFTLADDGFGYGAFNCSLPPGAGIASILPLSSAIYSPPPG